MGDSTRKLFHAGKTHQEGPTSAKVLISLNVPPDELIQAELREIGLKVEAVSGNKLVGEIASALLVKLEEHPSIVEVERSVLLSPKGDRRL